MNRRRDQRRRPSIRIVTATGAALFVFCLAGAVLIDRGAFAVAAALVLLIVGAGIAIAALLVALPDDEEDKNQNRRNRRTLDD